MLSRRIPQLRQTLKALSRSASSSSSSVPSKSQPSNSVPAPQAPNYASAWSTNQQPRSKASYGPRFEQTAMELQPNPLSAMELVANEPIRLVHGRKAVCDGGGGPLGHPKIFINLDQPGPRPCG
ncbi:ubiquinone oxidoreductase 20 kd subunit [Tricholoma matsutake]|nr:ubiquinone oxidoreductase 20 kd subunit [Tricholoma matsutake 945]